MSITKKTLCAVSDCGCAPDECECWTDEYGAWSYGIGTDAPRWEISETLRGDYRIECADGCHEQSIDVEDADELPRAARAMRAATAALEAVLEVTR
jgi:hypothetical protein